MIKANNKEFIATMTDYYDANASCSCGTMCDCGEMPTACNCAEGIHTNMSGGISYNNVKNTYFVER